MSSFLILLARTIDQKLKADKTELFLLDHKSHPKASDPPPNVPEAIAAWHGVVY